MVLERWFGSEYSGGDGRRCDARLYSARVARAHNHFAARRSDFAADVAQGNGYICAGLT